MCSQCVSSLCVCRACGEPDWGAGGPCAHSAYPPCVCAERVASLTGELEEARVLTVRILPACVQSVWRA